MLEPVCFDVETFTDGAYSLRKLSEVPYILDPRFELLSVAAAVDGKVRVWRGDNPEWLTLFRGWDAEGRRFVAHNARFDLRVLVLRFKFTPRLLGDTLGVARYFWFGRHGLDALGHELLNVGKQGAPLLGRRLAQITPAEWSALSRYNAADVVLCRRIWQLLTPQLPPGELQLIQQTLALQLRPQYIDEAGATELAARCVRERVPLESAYPVLLELCNRPAALKTHLQKTHGVSIPSIDKKKIGSPDQFGPGAADLLRGLWQYKELRKAEHDVKTLKTRMGLGDGTILVDLNYCGAHSHRWTSGGGEGSTSSFNYQNLSRGSGLRELNIPRPGRVFIVGDLAQIEARITAWLADEQSQLQIFREGRDPYLEFAQPLFGRPLTKADKVERAVGKEAVLGLGFGMGAKLFAERLRTGAPKALALLLKSFRVEDPVEAARRVVDTYRETYPKIKRNAALMFNTFAYVVEDTTAGRHACGCWVAIRRDGQSVVIELPTGGFLTYRQVGLTERVTDWGMELAPTYLGRRITFSMPIENAVQATARDIFGRALLELERAGFEIAFHVHDEVIVEVGVEEAVQRLEQFRQILGAPDPRCPDLPISCSAFLSDKYTKDEAYMAAFTQRVLEGDNPSCVPSVPTSNVGERLAGSMTEERTRMR
jgi:hypothetical protein